MAMEDYTDLRLSFERSGVLGAYIVTAATVDGRRAEAPFAMPLSEDAMMAAIRTFGATRAALAEVGGGRKVTPVATEHRVDLPDAAELGTALADALFSGDVEALFNDVRRTGAVRVRINVTDEPELVRVPWEFLRRNGKDLASQAESTIVRELDTDEPSRAEPVHGKVRMLGVIANPLGDLDVTGEKHRVQEALAACGDQVELTWLDDCTYQMLQRALQDRYHILHFVGHGAQTPDGDAIVLLTDENGQRQEVRANAIAQLVGGQSALQLVVLNSCEGARTTADSAFSSLATQLVQQGKSAVIAMQFEITDGAAKAFAAELYFSLVDRRFPIDVAVAEGRKAINNLNPIEFATPVLYLRPGSASLFEFASGPTPGLAGAAVASMSASPAASEEVIDLREAAPVAIPLAAAMEDDEQATVPTPPADPPSNATSPRPRRSRRLLYGAAVVAVVVIGAVAFAMSGDSGFDAAAAGETYIETELADDFGVNFEDARCDQPDGATVGATFSCTALLGDEEFSFAGEIIDAEAVTVTPEELEVTDADLAQIEVDAALALRAQTGAGVTAENVSCGTGPIVVPWPYSLPCAVFDPQTGRPYNVDVFVDIYGTLDSVVRSG